MKKNTFTAGPILVVDTDTVMNPPTVGSPVTVPPTVTASLLATTAASAFQVLPAYAKPIPDISRIEVFASHNFKMWQELIYSTLDMQGVAWLLSAENMHVNTKAWAHTNKGCRHTILTTLSNEFFLCLLCLQGRKDNLEVYAH